MQLARCQALDRSARPRASELLAALEQAHENVLSGHFEVFLSYAWGAKAARKPLADELYLALRAAGLRVWMDSVEMGHDLQASMSEGIAKSDVVAVLASPDYARSGPCLFELRSAAGAGKPLVACCVEPGFWRGWGLAPDGSGARALPDEHELVALARLGTHLFADFGEASSVNWAAERVSDADRKKLTLPEALPRLLALIDAARKDSAGGGAGSGGSGTGASSAARASSQSSTHAASSANHAPSLSTTNPAAGSSTAHDASQSSVSEGGAAASPAAATAAEVWTRHSDGADEWFVSVSGEAAWTLPPGAVVVEAVPAPAQVADRLSAPHAEAHSAALPDAAQRAGVWTRHSDGADEWFVSASGEAAWTLPQGAVVAGEAAPAPASGPVPAAANDQNAAAAQGAARIAIEEDQKQGRKKKKRQQAQPSAVQSD